MISREVVHRRSKKSIQHRSRKVRKLNKEIKPQKAGERAMEITSGLLSSFSLCVEDLNAPEGPPLQKVCEPDQFGESSGLIWGAS